MDKISQKKAKELGLKRYYTGDPCPHGHISEKYVGGGCVTCMRIKGKTRIVNPMDIQYRGHKSRSKRRNIPFLLTFKQWCKWWLDSGHYHERGPKADQYVMARFGDKGAYELGNIKCITSNENRREASVNSPIITCPHCKAIGGSGDMRRWHFNNCKFNPQSNLNVSNLLLSNTNHVSNTTTYLA